MSRARLHPADVPFAAEFGDGGQLRQSVGKTGRMHLDRWLPYVVLNRSAKPTTSIARRIAVNSPAYLIWSPEDDAVAEKAFDALRARIIGRFGGMLVVVLDDAPWQSVPEGTQSLPPFEFSVAASQSPNARTSLETLAEALADIQIDLRQPRVREGTSIPLAFADLGAVDLLSLSIPQIHKVAENTFYPQLTHDLALAVGDALLKAACAFIAATQSEAPAHYRSLGRSAFLAAALDADKRLDRVARSFDFLLSVSPINNREAMEQFFACGEEKAPELRYRPLTVDPDTAKRDLYAVDLSIVEDPLLEQLLSEKRQEIDHQLTMLATRNTRAFQAASLLHYGTVSSRLRSDALSVLAGMRTSQECKERLGAREVAVAAQALIDRYRAEDPAFEAVVEVRDDVGSLMVSGGRLMVAGSLSILRSRLDALLSHEISIHLLTHFNGAAQGLTVFRTGLARYEGLQEGLGVFAEWAVGGLSRARMRLLAGRVLAVDAMLDGASFVDVYRMLTKEHGLKRKPAFDVTTRVFRSGGFAKDLIYLKGFRSVMRMVSSDASLRPFWIGKIATGHVAAIEELMLRGLVQPPVFEPEFLRRPDVQRRISSIGAKTSFDKILAVE